MKPESDPLLRSVLADEKLERVRAQSLATGLATLRQRRRRRALLGTATGTLALATALALTLLPRPQQPPREPRATSPENVAQRSVRFLSDEELLARFPGRPVALVGAPGQQRLIFLDGKSATDSSR